MSAEKLFTDEELKQLGERTVDLLEASIDKGDQERSKLLAKRMYAEFGAMHDLYRDWVTHLLTFIGRRFGDEVLHAALEETVGAFTRQLGQRYAGKGTKRKMEILTAGLRGHLQAFEVNEEAGQFTITAPVCGSGGRLVKDGGYEPPDSFLKIEKSQPMTFNRPNFPVYCAHCYFQNVSPAEPGGDPLFVTEPAEEVGHGPCRVRVRK
jgi:hypothetical protein